MSPAGIPAASAGRARGAGPLARYGAVAVGGFAGTLLRYALTAPLAGGTSELATAGINVAGALVLGTLTGLWSAGRGPGSRTAWVRAGLGPGLLGGFTTFSAIAVAFAHPFRPEALLLQAALGVAAAALGLVLGRALGSASRGGGRNA